MDTNTTRFEVNDKVAWITLNRPEAMNSLNPELRWQLSEHLDEVERNDDIWLAIITGAGSRSFCAGADLKHRAIESQASDQQKQLWREQAGQTKHIAERWHFCKPLIAMVNGFALGGGLEIALACDIIIAADGIHSTIRRKYYPDERNPIYAGINLWRGTTWQKPFLSGQTMILAGTLKSGKMVIYPISQPNQDGKTLINWVAEVRTDTYKNNDWSRTGRLEDFAHRYADWKFNWLDVPSMIQSAEQILEYPMVDRDPVDRWVFGRVALLGDSAHPMYSIGANGAGQAILDARTLAGLIKSHNNPIDALKAYEVDRLPVTAGVVHANRSDGPDYLLEIVAERAPEPVSDIHSVISQEEIEHIGAKYRKITGYDRDTLNSRSSLVP